MTAADANADDQKPSVQQHETYAGIDYTGRGLASYSTSVWSPFSAVGDPGLRFRAGQSASFYGETSASTFATAFLPKGAKTLTDVSAGYQFHVHDWWIKAYAGVALQANVKLFREAQIIFQKRDRGAKADVELWRRYGERIWLAANASWLEVDRAKSIYAKAGYDIARFEKGTTLALGAELSFARSTMQRFYALHARDETQDTMRGGGIVSFRAGPHDLSLSGGMIEGADDRVWKPYATLTYGRQF